MNINTLVKTLAGILSDKYDVKISINLKEE